MQASEAELLEALKKIEALEIDGEFAKNVEVFCGQHCSLTLTVTN